MLWEGNIVGLILTVLTYPVFPFAYLFFMLAKTALFPPPTYVNKMSRCSDKIDSGRCVKTTNL